VSSRLRSVAIIELLTRHPYGLPSATISQTLGIPLAATERLLLDLVQTDYIALSDDRPTYRLRMKIAALGLAYLGASGVTDLVQPILDDLAKRTGELVRLAIIEGDHLTWVAKAQGSKSGLIYSPDTSAEVNLPKTANGQAWLACLPQKDIEHLLARRIAGDGKKEDLKPAAMQELVAELEVAKRRGYAFVSESYQTGTSAIATAIRELGTGIPLGTVSIAGPTLRMNSARVEEMASWLIDTAKELAAAAASSPLFAAR
jgi:IclR family acetate operon transcriptional repressor